MRVLIGGIMHESNTFSSQKTTRRQFEEGSLTEGAGLVGVWRDAHHEVGGFLEGAEKFGFEAIPATMAWATPGGPVDDEVIDEVVDRLIDDYKRERPDGVLLALHGAMVTPTHADADGDVLRRIRAAIGPDVPLAATLDFHGNVSDMAVAQANALIAYQTYPHVDQREIGVAAARLMERMLRGEISPKMKLMKPRLVINLLGQETAREPMASLVAKARRAELRSRMLAVSVMAGFPYADVPHMGPAILAIADDDPKQAFQYAYVLARDMWDRRSEFNPACLGAAEAVARGAAGERRPVILVDLGDNIGGGSAGDGTVLLAELMRQQVSDALVVIFDPSAVAVAHSAGVGGAFESPVGGKTDEHHGGPVLLRGIVRSLHDGSWVEEEARHGGRRENGQGATAVVEMQGGTFVVLNSLRTPPFSLGQITSLGIDPSRRSMIVVKAAVAYKAAYQPIAGEVIEVDTPGLTTIDLRRFRYRNRRIPMYPLEQYDDGHHFD
jgi:microcystin degradation protein MlrC